MRARISPLSAFLMAGILLVLASCTAHEQAVEACVSGAPAGFWLGLWHGAIAPFTFVISLFSDTITVFEVNNNGGWYLFGFLLGIGAFTSGGSAGGRAVRRRRE
ncbi:MAG: hypothetical protein D6722_15860 [Bacteroidetes bacterium]|nr:MAG: hypothetical protein D6722_15860 [Bacteroidota bacterium]